MYKKAEASHWTRRRSTSHKTSAGAYPYLGGAATLSPTSLAFFAASDGIVRESRMAFHVRCSFRGRAFWISDRRREHSLSRCTAYSSRPTSRTPPPKSRLFSRNRGDPRVA
ncbi:hypothetical protein HPP92_001133 [Vanilla planifolia]|uniref:Uncharacterized protein n=1 Tax=Vanilla planifolia TaxID=51239 RepID=A0A835S740_VANPL|nr:hypothetical protein HPP92_001133 [Vanilla planifolia]